jgi:hypothetical protein
LEVFRDEHDANPRGRRDPEMNVFFSHASEDKAVVKQVLARVRDAYPDIEAWLDTYEIKGGDDLIDKIAAGIDDADKFLIFLSEKSIGKPWVKAELKKALVAEIEGVKPEFIIPVKLGTISKFPAFLESKYYIDLEAQTEGEWLNEIHVAVTGKRTATGPEAEENLRVSREAAADDPDVVAIVFDAQYWAEPIAFPVTTTAPILERSYQLLPPQKGGTITFAEQEQETTYAVALPQHRIGPGQSFVMMMKFEPGTDHDAVIAKVDRWDGSDSTKSGMNFL